MARFLRLRRVRLQRKLTVFDLAERVGVSPLTVRLWERGLATPTDANKVRVEKALGIPWPKLSASDREMARR